MCVCGWVGWGGGGGLTRKRPAKNLLGALVPAHFSFVRNLIMVRTIDSNVGCL